MAEYIEREAAIALYEDDAVDMSVLKVPVPVVIQNLKDIPAADVAPVRHGRWIWTETGKEDYEQYWVCSACGGKCYWQSKFCSECGALMDKDGDA